MCFNVVEWNVRPHSTCVIKPWVPYNVPSNILHHLPSRTFWEKSNRAKVKRENSVERGHFVLPAIPKLSSRTFLWPTKEDIVIDVEQRRICWICMTQTRTSWFAKIKIHTLKKDLHIGIKRFTLWPKMVFLFQ